MMFLSLKSSTFSNIFKKVTINTNKNGLFFVGQRNLNTTALNDFHVKNGGKMVNFCGWSLPMQYADLRSNQSHLHTRKAASLFDVSHMLQMNLHGKDRVEFFEKMVVADVKGLKKDFGCLSLYTNENGGIIDDLVVTNAGDHLYVVSNAGRMKEDLAHLNSHIQPFQNSGKDVKMEILCRSLLAFQGPKAAAVLSKFAGEEIKSMAFMTGIEVSIDGFSESCRVTRCGYTGEDGYEISVANGDAVKLAEMLTGEEEVKLAGLGPRDSLRLEAGLCLYGNDITENTTPIEAALAWTIAKRRRAEGGFIGSDAILEQLQKKGGKQRRVGITIEGKSPARAGSEIFQENGLVIGHVTSGLVSPSIEKAIGMAYINKPFNKVGTDVFVKIRNKMVGAKVTKMPFVPQQYYKPS